MKRTLLLCFLVSHLAGASDNDDRFRPDPWQLNARVGFGVSLPSTAANSDKRFPLTAGLGVDYFASRVLGVFLAPEILTRGFSQGGKSATAPFLDLLLGVSVRLGARWFAEDSTSLFRFAAFYSLPLSPYSSAVSLPFGQGSRGYFGITFLQDILFPVSEHGKIGFSVGGKVGLGDSTSGGDIKFYEAVFTFVAALR